MATELLQTACPVPGFPAVVCDGENTDGSRLEVDDVVRKTRHRPASNGQVGLHPRHRSARPWHRHDLMRGVNYFRRCRQLFLPAKGQQRSVTHHLATLG